jgi:hypothetical protein
MSGEFTNLLAVAACGAVVAAAETVTVPLSRRAAAELSGFTEDLGELSVGLRLIMQTAGAP